nr:hypothetical protein BaRGS_005177 [Batillaria attramentaria]
MIVRNYRAKPASVLSELIKIASMMSSTLVETVSINYEDFNDSFLTCGTCLCTYDGTERTPKLLPCSHTVCRSCLERIVAAQTLAHLCIKNLNAAYDAVSEELRQLELSVDKTLDSINRSFQDVIAVGTGGGTSVCSTQYHQKISDLNEKLDTTSTLSEPRENSFLRYDYKHNDALREIAKAVSNFGHISVSTTFPALSTAKICPTTAHLRSSVRISTVDYHGNPRLNGGDPVVVELRTEKGDLVETKLKDNDDGTYDVLFLPQKPGKLKLCASIFNRPIRDSPFSIDVSDHINPVGRFGSRGSGLDNFSQPVRICVGSEDTIHVLDTGNSRVKVLSQSGEVLRIIGPEGLEGQSATGLSLTPDGHLAVINWRTKLVSVVSPEGELVRQFTNPGFLEPIDIAVNSRGEVIVADAGASKIFIFDTSGNLTTTFGSHGDKDGQFKLISALTVGKNDEILIADHRIQIFTKDGKFSRRLVDSGKGHYGGITVDSSGHILATKTEKGRSYVQILSGGGKPLYFIDSHDDKLKRPSGLAVMTDFRLVVADLGNDCVKKYRYK